MKWFKKKEVPEVEEYKLKDREMEKLSESFVSRDEKYIASLGNGYIMNYLANKSAKKGFAFITDKRVYFKGSCLSGTGKKLVKTNEERTVDVKNITGSGFTYHRYWGILVALFISVITALVGAVGTVWLSYEELWPDMWTIREIRDYEEVKKIWGVVLDKLDEIESSSYEDEIEGVLQYKNKNYEIEIRDFKQVYLTDDGGADIDYFRIDGSDWKYLWNENIVKDFFDETGYEIIDAEGYLRYCLNIAIECRLYGIDYEIECLKASSHSIIEINLLTLLSLVSIGLFLSLTVICCIGIKNYLFKRKTLFRIEYAGGCIAFNVSFYAKAEIDDFQKQLRRAKDMAEENASVKAITVETSGESLTQNNAADDLRKYAELVKDGLITQDEYDAMKKKILGL